MLLVITTTTHEILSNCLFYLTSSDKPTLMPLQTKTTITASDRANPERNLISGPLHEHILVEIAI